MQERRPNLTDPAVVDALAHPVRLDVLGFLMARGPATASECARAVGDTPSNCSYHLRVLAAHGLVVAEEAAKDGRTRPWRATVTGFTTDAGEADDAAATDAMMAATVELDHQLAREHLRNRESLPEPWRGLDAHASYGLAATPAELAEIAARIDAVVRPYIQATREDVPDGAEHVHLSFSIFPRLRFGR